MTTIEELKAKLAQIETVIYFDEEQFLREKTAHPEVLKGWIQQAERLLENTFNDDVYFLHGMIGNLYRIIGESETAIFHLKQALEFAYKEGSMTKQVISLIRYGEARKYNGEPYQALHHFQEALESCKAYKVEAYVDFALQHQGKCLLELGNNQEALQCFLQALERRQLKGNPSLIQSTKQAIRFVEQLNI